MSNGTPPLREVVAHLAELGKEFFTLDDLETMLGLEDRPHAYAMVQRLTRARLIRRVKGGVYAIAPPPDWAGDERTAINWYAAAAHAVEGEPYYLAYYTAMELHRMLQHPLRTVFVAVTAHHRPLVFGPARIRFVKLTPKKLFGDERRRLDGYVLNVARLERTFLDCVDRPDLCGGIEEVFRGFVRRQADLDADRLLGFVHRLDKPVLTKRLGFLLEAAGYAEPETLWELERAAGRLKRFKPLDKTRPHDGGERNRRWELIINVDVQRLLRGART
jgi:predicted transcriptional regulator of viral defense system